MARYNKKQNTIINAIHRIAIKISGRKKIDIEYSGHSWGKNDPVSTISIKVLFDTVYVMDNTASEGVTFRKVFMIDNAIVKIFSDFNVRLDEIDINKYKKALDIMNMSDEELELYLKLI